MRLLTKTSLYFLLSMVPLLVICGLLLFNQFNREFNQRMDEELLSEEIEWIRFLKSESREGRTFVLRTPEIVISPVRAQATLYPSITNTTDYKPGEDKTISYRLLSHVLPIDGVIYQIRIRKSQEQRTLLIANVTRIMLLVFGGLFICMLMFNWFISRRIWKPFRKSLDKIRSAELHKMEAMHFDSSDIKEFHELNSSLNSMTKKIHNDYLNMKEFTENAAHEMQTPIAVVQSKTELLLQDDNLNEGQIDLVSEISAAMSRLTKLNSSLLLLARIENNQYEPKEILNFSELIRKFLKQFGEIIQFRKLNMDISADRSFNVLIHPFLAESLISNLIGNAIKYNHENGQVRIFVDEHSLVISNTSNQPPIDTKVLFKRFNSSRLDDESSNGLGLAIVKKIADSNNLDIKYESANGWHHFRITHATTAL